MSPSAGPLAANEKAQNAPRPGTFRPLTPTKDGPRSRRLSSRRLAAIAAQLSERDREVLRAVARFRVMSGSQLGRLFWSASSVKTQARLTRRGLARLSDLDVLQPLARRVGGARGGSATTVFAPGRAGQYLLRGDQSSGRRVRRAHTPGERYLAHALAVADLYVGLMEIERGGAVQLLSFEAEPDCWRPYPGAFGARLVLKPDAYVKLAAGDYEYSWFIERDMATEAQTTVAIKARRYHDYFRIGSEQADGGVFPRTAWIVPDADHAERVVATLGSLPTEAWRLFVVAPATEALALLSGEVRS